MLEEIIRKYNLVLNTRDKKYVSSNNYTLIVNNNEYYLIKYKINTTCKNNLYRAKNYYKREKILNLTDYIVEYEDDLGIVYISSMSSSIPLPNMICDSSLSEWKPGMPLNYIGRCESLENRVKSGLDVLVAGITYNGINRNTKVECDLKSRDIGCCNYGGQQGFCIAACPLLSAVKTINSDVFPPTSEVYSLLNKPTPSLPPGCHTLHEGDAKWVKDAEKVCQEYLNETDCNAEDDLEKTSARCKWDPQPWCHTQLSITGSEVGKEAEKACQINFTETDCNEEEERWRCRWEPPSPSPTPSPTSSPTPSDVLWSCDADSARCIPWRLGIRNRALCDSGCIEEFQTYGCVSTSSGNKCVAGAGNKSLNDCKDDLEAGCPDIADDMISCLEIGNVWVDSKCIKSDTKYHINKYSKIDSRLCSNSNNNIMEDMAATVHRSHRSGYPTSLTGKNSKFGLLEHPFSNNPASAVILLGLWLAAGQNIENKLYEKEDTDHEETYKDVAYYLTTEFPQGRHSDGGEEASGKARDIPGGYIGEYYDDLEWWTMAKVQALYSLMNVNAKDYNIDMLSYQFIGVIRTVMYMWYSVDNVCGGGTLWQASEWNRNAGKGAITNALLIYNALAVYKFYYKYKDIEPFKSVLTNLNNKIIINSKTTMSIPDILSELEKLIISQFIWFISPIGDTTRVQGMLDNNPKAGMRGRIYDSLISHGIEGEDMRCWPPGVSNLYREFKELWTNTGSKWVQDNGPLMKGCRERPEDCSKYNGRELCKATIPSNPELSIGTIDPPKCYVSWADKEEKDWATCAGSWHCDEGGRSSSTSCKSRACNATTYNQGMFTAICSLLADTFKTNNKEPLTNKEFDLRFYNYDIFGEDAEQLPSVVNLKDLSEDDAVNAMINLALTSTEFSYEHLSLQTSDSDLIISDADLARSCTNAGGEDAIFFRSIQAYGITTLIGTLENVPSRGNSDKFISKYKKYINDTGNYIWNNTRNPLSNVFSQCYPTRNAGSYNDPSVKIPEYSNREAITENKYAPKGHGSSTLIIQCQHIISSNDYKLLGVFPNK
tara:strand:+ start:289 stop:3453 length:3165 start_codon:yes stop_codon:yes gene_type:complete